MTKLNDLKVLAARCASLDMDDNEDEFSKQHDLLADMASPQTILKLIEVVELQRKGLKAVFEDEFDIELTAAKTMDACNKILEEL